ncbi:hypothetical protein COT47_01955 [Candidatus Woesearchaeota archaeon CG08_land_8_20_14_0_20_43_7]|nr:MAG: hypothetical protein COT47_01955 [Candidatus Woesearchaeota archaeon CG08_land_8_20_14_0_20_43_7]
MGKTVGIISVKGGVGKTTSVSNLGAVLSQQFNKKVLMVDANFSAPNLGLHVGLIAPDTTLHDVLDGDINVREAIQRHTLGFDVLPSSLMGGSTRMQRLKEVLDSVKKDYDIVLIDSSPNVNDELLATIRASDELLVVTSPDYPTLYMTISAIKVAKRRKTPVTGLILNKVRGRKYELSISKIEESAEVPVLAQLPDDEKILESIAQSIPSAALNHKTDSTIEFCKLAACLMGEVYQDKRFKTRLKQVFRRGIPKEELNRSIVLG